MKNKIVIILILLSIVFPVNIKAMTSNEVIEGTYEYSSLSETKVRENTFIYKDEYFTKSSYIGNQELEILSIEVASSSISRFNASNMESSLNVSNMLKDMGFSNVTTNDYYKIEKEAYSMGVIIGMRKITVDDNTYTLLAVVPRSAGYKDEWISNFTIGDTDIHEGFKIARDEILRYMKKYISDNNIHGMLKVWVPGYSRGAAIANNVAGFLASGTDYFEGVTIDSKDVYSYSIGTPSVVKNNPSKKEVLSVLGNTNPNDTIGAAYIYNGEGTIDTKDIIYSGIYNVINPNDLFPLLPPSYLGFTRFGNDIDATLNMDDDMLDELKSFSPYIYDIQTRTFNKVVIDFDTLTLKNTEEIDGVKFINDRLNSLSKLIKNTKDYKEGYQEVINALAYIYGTSETLSLETISIDDYTKYIPTLTYLYLSAVSDNLIKDGTVTTEEDAITLALTNIIKYITGEDINYKTLTLDELFELAAKHITSNEKVLDMVVNAIINAIPEDQRYLILMVSMFDKSETPTTESVLKAFIKACYYGADPDSSAYADFKEAKEVRYALYGISGFLLYNYPDVLALMYDSNGNATGENKVSDYVAAILDIVKTVKDDDGNVIKKYDTISELANASLIDLFNEVEVEYVEGKDNKDKLIENFNIIKDNINTLRTFISTFVYDNDVSTMVSNILTLVGNIDKIIMPHLDELYLTIAKNSNHYPEHTCIKGDNQTVNIVKEKLEFEFSIDYDKFTSSGEVYVDNNLVDPKNYDSKAGSTIITFKDSYLKTLSLSSHEIKVVTLTGEVKATFNLTKITNPNTFDNIITYISLLGLSILGLYESKKLA